MESTGVVLVMDSILLMLAFMATAAVLATMAYLSFCLTYFFFPVWRNCTVEYYVDIFRIVGFRRTLRYMYEARKNREEFETQTLLRERMTLHLNTAKTPREYVWDLNWYDWHSGREVTITRYGVLESWYWMREKAGSFRTREARYSHEQFARLPEYQLVVRANELIKEVHGRFKAELREANRIR
ncbi:MAG: hypothetical protein KGI60_01315 [Patescibacteria group bacterium]|nr:hypothetical protein [Patescibacteria group bacterium]